MPNSKKRKVVMYIDGYEVTITMKKAHSEDAESSNSDANDAFRGCPSPTAKELESRAEANAAANAALFGNEG